MLRDLLECTCVYVACTCVYVCMCVCVFRRRCVFSIVYGLRSMPPHTHTLLHTIPRTHIRVYIHAHLPLTTLTTPPLPAHSPRTAVSPPMCRTSSAVPSTLGPPPRTRYGLPPSRAPKKRLNEIRFKMTFSVKALRCQILVERCIFVLHLSV